MPRGRRTAIGGIGPPVVGRWGVTCLERPLGPPPLCPGPRPNPANPSIHCTGECGFRPGQGVGIGISRPHNHSEICSLEALHCLGCVPGGLTLLPNPRKGVAPQGMVVLGCILGLLGWALLSPPAAGGAEAPSAGGPRGGAGVDQGVSPLFHPTPAPRSPPGPARSLLACPLRSASRLLTKKDPSHSSRLQGGARPPCTPGLPNTPFLSLHHLCRLPLEWSWSEAGCPVWRCPLLGRGSRHPLSLLLPGGEAALSRPLGDSRPAVQLLGGLVSTGPSLGRSPLQPSPTRSSNLAEVVAVQGERPHCLGSLDRASLLGSGVRAGIQLEAQARLPLLSWHLQLHVVNPELSGVGWWPA